MRVKIEEVEATVEIEIPRAYWRYLFAGLALVSYPATMAVPGGAAAAAIRDADALLAELEKGGGDAR